MLGVFPWKFVTAECALTILGVEAMTSQSKNI